MQNAPAPSLVAMSQKSAAAVQGVRHPHSVAFNAFQVSSNRGSRQVQRRVACEVCIEDMRLLKHAGASLVLLPFTIISIISPIIIIIMIIYLYIVCIF